MESPGPRQAHGRRDFADDAARAPGHLERRAARKREKEEALRIGAVRDEMRDAMRQRIGLARAGAGEDQERPLAMAGGRALRGV